MNILYLNSDGAAEYNSGRWRCAHPADALRQQGHNVFILSIKHWLHDTPVGRYAFANADVIVIQRVLIKESVAQAEKWRSKGKIVIADWDDHYISVNPTNPAWQFWREGMVEVSTGYTSYKKNIGYDPLVEFERGLSICSAGTTPSSVMVNDYIRYGNVFYLPNYIDSRMYHGFQKHDHDGEIWIGWGGSLGHIESFEHSGVAEALKQVLQEHSHVRFMLVGDQRILDKLSLPRNKVIFRPYVAYYNWPAMLAQFDIAIAPLAGAFDKRRSFLKAVESCVAKIPLVATGDASYPVYKEFFDCPSHMYIASEEVTPSKDARTRLWTAHLNAMIDNLGHYQENADTKGYDFGMQYDVFNNTDKIINIYERAGELP